MARQPVEEHNARIIHVHSMDAVLQHIAVCI